MYFVLERVAKRLVKHCFTRTENFSGRLLSSKSSAAKTNFIYTLSTRGTGCHYLEGAAGNCCSSSSLSLIIPFHSTGKNVGAIKICGIL